MNLRRALLALALTASGLAWGQPADAPERVARLSYVEGEVRFQGASESPTNTLPDRPLIPGDQLTTGPGGRAELAFGSAAIRLDEGSELSVTDLQERTVRVELAGGTASVHLYELLEDETFEIETPNAYVALREPGEYRLDITPGGATDLSVRAGAAEVVTAGGPVRVAGGQRVRLEGSQALASLVTPQPADAFDNWVLEREVQLAEAAPPRDEGEEYEGEETLDDYGEWRDDPAYGRVWMPSYAYGGYDPFGTGYWAHTGYSYTWVNPMPWGRYTDHCGRWNWSNRHNRWVWVDDRPRPVRPPQVARRDGLIERVMDKARDRGIVPEARRASGSRSDAVAQSRTVAPSREPARRVSNRGNAVERAVAAARSAQTAAAARPRSAPTAQPSSTPPARPARPSSSSSSSRPVTRTSSSSTTNTNKSFGKPHPP